MMLVVAGGKQRGFRDKINAFANCEQVGVDLLQLASRLSPRCDSRPSFGSDRVVKVGDRQGVPAFAEILADDLTASTPRAGVVPAASVPRFPRHFVLQANDCPALREGAVPSQLETVCRSIG
jgi:hypothetical protein